MKKHLNLHYKKGLNKKKSTFVAPKASFRASTEAGVKCASSIHCALALLSPLSWWLPRLSLLPALVPVCALCAWSRVCCWPWQTPECRRSWGGTENSPSPYTKVTVCAWFVPLLLHSKGTALAQAWSRSFGDVFVGQSHNKASLGEHIPVPSQHFCSPSLVRQVCVLSLNADKNREHFDIVIGCVEMLPTGMPFRCSLSCSPVEGDKLQPPVHFTHWIKDKIEAFLKDWVALKMSEYLGLKTYEISFLILFRSNYWNKWIYWWSKEENVNLEGLIVHLPFELLNSEDQVMKFMSQRRDESML